ncbi:hypothetical protein B6N60_02573 [Richelia sinica FACHB-800]|uniref:Uncharacterized protein n=1 Tax=Richelia sinica FACHB-800 TaxID=1357546 RepID=A0A975Y559_9NOST|nr:hypothetical protein [Richelia sinica]MBD2666266.1 hypothetical protein [Richelia sinica FACHB-800]QXE23877.1 hypothetical protein B6N60_02573 [Richelia sinica FACHB-800]
MHEKNVKPQILRDLSIAEQDIFQGGQTSFSLGQMADVLGQGFPNVQPSNPFGAGVQGNEVVKAYSNNSGTILY